MGGAENIANKSLEVLLYTTFLFIIEKLSYSYKLQLPFKSQEDYTVDKKKFSLNLLHQSNHNLLRYSANSDFKEIGYLYKSPSNAKINSASESRRSIPSNNKKILIVDDVENVALFFKLALEQAGFVVDMYNNPLKSLSDYRVGKYDLILLDIRMPAMNGFQLYSKIRQLDVNAKVCFMTAFEEYYDEFKRLFPDPKNKKCFIRKPIGVNDLIKTVKSHLN
jgi:CheY-like chemotaxis protein